MTERDMFLANQIPHGERVDAFGKSPRIATTDIGVRAGNSYITGEQKVRPT
jgi:hypothetical protein